MSSKYFTTDWFSINISKWSEVLADLKDKPDINGLEIGVFQGRSVCWLLDNIFTHSSAKLDAVDTFNGNIEHLDMKEVKTELTNLYATFVANTAEYGDKLTAYKMPSQRFLTCFSQQNLYDFIYIDGDHHSWACLEDMVLSWPKLKVGGIMIIDDYGGGTKDTPKYELVRHGVNSFINAYESRYKVIDIGYQFILQKIS
jgi:predicted O-methyltransferase YrrM